LENDLTNVNVIDVEPGLVLMAENLVCDLLLEILNPSFPEHVLQEHRFPEILMVFLIFRSTEFGALL